MAEPEENFGGGIDEKADACTRSGIYNDSLQDGTVSKLTDIATAVSLSRQNTEASKPPGDVGDGACQSFVEGVGDVASLSLPSLAMTATCLADVGKFFIRRPRAADRRPGSIDHAKTLSLIGITAFAIVLFIVWLKGVMVPLVLAGFFTFQLEPVMFFILNPCSLFASCSRRAKERSKRIDQERVKFFSGFVAEDMATDEENTGNDGKQFEEPRRKCKPRSLIWSIQAALAVFVCLFSLLITIAACFYTIFRSFEQFSWQKYADSPRLRMLLLQIQKLHSNSDELKTMKKVADEVDFTAVGKWFMQGPWLKRLFNLTLSFVGTMFLMGLFLAFLLLSDLATDDVDGTGIRRKARLSVRRYMRVKTMTSTVVALLVWAVLETYKVDLAPLFAFLTCILNFIPHIGYTVATLLPIPLVFFDPTKTLSDALVVALWQVLIHSIFSHLIEPRFLARSLDLHPVVVIASLAFWIVCWGAVGAILSAPMTSILRLVLLEFEHPYALIAVGILEGRWDAFPEKIALGPVIKKQQNSAIQEAWMTAVSPPNSPQRMAQSPTTSPSRFGLYRRSIGHSPRSPRSKIAKSNSVD